MIKYKNFLRVFWHTYCCFPHLAPNLVPVLELWSRIKSASSNVFDTQHPQWAATCPKGYPWTFMGSSKHFWVIIQSYSFRTILRTYIFLQHNIVFAVKLSPQFIKLSKTLQKPLIFRGIHLLIPSDVHTWICYLTYMSRTLLHITS